MENQENLVGKTCSPCSCIKGRKLPQDSQKGSEADRSVIDEGVVVLRSIDKGQAGLPDTIDTKARTCLEGKHSPKRNKADMKARTCSSCSRLKGRKLPQHSKKGSKADQSIIDEGIVVLGSVDEGQVILSDMIDTKARTCLKGKYSPKRNKIAISLKRNAGPDPHRRSKPLSFQEVDSCPFKVTFSSIWILFPQSIYQVS